MYAALLNKNLVLAVTEADLIRRGEKRLVGQQYLCPRCHKRVQLIIKASKPYFKHRPRISHLQGEKEEHAMSKALLQSALCAAGFRAQTEVTLAAGQLRADVLASSQLAFEVQCAPLSKTEFTHRHQLYCQIGIADLWVVGRRHYLQAKIKTSQLIFFRKNQVWRTYYFEIDPYHRQLRLKYNVLLEPLTNKLHYQIEYFSLDATGLRALWQFQPALKQYEVQPAKQKHYLELQLAEKSKKGSQIAWQLYQRQMTINDLPSWVFGKMREVNYSDNVTQYFKLNASDNQRKR
ncbi:competence protein CoiA family protein [Lactobacillus sp. ESL0785]|uniref:competence protein CoiA family protein n=1 Tax=Lactobacillus sp. ESL0785 TaxID=2983232 RepID=UPI0023F96495|nr:competence protein CoiA family protein [Lactobacillus sp. ESL0785]WEV71349.1 competence protein CoiA family protein [Lactobacillus sp. ESL0785]